MPWRRPPGTRSCTITWARHSPTRGPRGPIAEFREAVRWARFRGGELRAGDGRRRPDASVACLREALRSRPDDAKVHLNLGITLVHQRHVNEAIDLYREAIRSHPEFANADKIFARHGRA